MTYTALILHDNQGLGPRIINLGDQALTDGFLRCLERHESLKIISGGRKNLPFFNRTHFSRHMSLSEIQAVFYRFLAGALKKYSQSAIHEKKLFSLLKSHPFIQNPFFAALDRRFAARQSKNIGETISPFIFKKLFISGLIEKIHAADIVFCNVGGLISDHLEFYLPCYLFECFLAKELGKPVVSMNQTIAVNKALNRKMVAWVYSLLDYHVTREPLSADALIGMGIDKHRVMTSCDSAFAADYTIDESAAAYSTPSPALNHGGIGFAIRGDRGIDHVRTSELLKAVGQRFNAPVFFFTTCKAHDEHVYKKLSKTTELSYLDFNNDYRLLTHFLKNLDMVITDRYHAAIFAMLAATPIIPLKPQTIKLEGLFRQFQYPISLKSLEHLSVGELIDSIEFVYQKKSALQELLAAASRSLKSKAISDMDHVVNNLIPRCIPG